MKKYIISGLLLLGVIIPVSLFGQTNADIDPNGPVSSCISLNNNLRYQSRDINTNGEVSTLQDFLQSKGYLNSEPTGYFGLLTLSAVKSFQSASGIEPTGYVGPITRARIQSSTCGGTTTDYPNPIMCTMEAKQCPDGSYVGRTGPRCEFTKCPTTINPIDSRGCRKGQVFSSTTGERCDTNFPPGCYSNTGFSSTTGVSCGNSTRVSISGVSGPQSLNVNQTGTWTVKASSSNGENLSYSVTWGDEFYFAYNNQSAMTLAPRPQQSATFSHTYSTKGTYSPVFTVTNSSGQSAKTSLSVDVNLTTTCSTSGFDTRTSLRCGCSTINGFSSVNGLSCNILSEVPVISHLQLGGCTSNIGSISEDDLCGAAPIGGTVYVFGDNLTSDAEIYFGDGRQVATPRFSSVDSTLSFVVPEISGSFTSISVKVELGGKSYISNLIRLPLR